MNSVTLFVENLAGDLGTDAYLTSNKFDGVEQGNTSGMFNFKQLIPTYRPAPTPDRQQDTGFVLKKDPITVDQQVINGQQAISNKYRNDGTNTHGKIVNRLYSHKSDAQGASTGDNLASRLSK